MTEYVILDTDKDLLCIEENQEGKFFHYLPKRETEPGVRDAFAIGLSWSSISTLQKLSQKESFEWVISDETLMITGKGPCWELRFRILMPPFNLVTVVLNEEETKRLKAALFS